ncbi:MAG: molybdopterin-dependent oxidoreductase [Dehalococcoidales bacterium]|nr:molybdopterin-dependent oxidoreductase [Dehalococcoidales bacterium]
MSDSKKVTLTINGKKQEVTVSPDMVLIDLLRDDMHLTGTKQSCDRKGQCGACTVIVDNKAVRSCLTKVVNLEGSEVITVEGLGTPDNPHLIQEAYVLAGAIQCGFCTPGMIMATKALLDQNQNPTDADIKKALARNLCRCTGYTKIIEAVKLAASFIRGETTPEKVRAEIPEKAMGVSHPRPSAMIKACGLAKFGADYYFDNALEMACVHSTEHHAKIVSVDTSEAEKMPGVAGIMTAADVPGTNRIRLMVPDEPVLCEDTVRKYGDPIAIVAAETRAQARAAAAAVKVTYDPLPVVRTAREAIAEGAPQLHAHGPNLIMAMPLKKGDAEKALAEAYAVVEGNFTTQMNHQAPLEPEVTIAYFNGEGENPELVIIGRSINIHAAKAQIQETIGYDNVRYQEPYVGGQFGIKATLSSECLAAAAAVYFKRPVRYVPNIDEAMWVSSKRHPFDMDVKLAVDEKGIITAYDIEMLENTGAYSGIGFIPVSRALHMLSSSYNMPNINALGKVIYANDGSGGAARGAGPPQACFALESAMDMMAEKLNIDPLEFRRMNALDPKKGHTKSTGMAVKVWPFPEMCDLIQPKYEKAKKEAEEYNKSATGPIRRGVGIAANSFGIAEAGDRADLAVEVDPDDGITIYAAIADPGEGNDAMLTQIAGHVLDIPMNKVRLYTRDTDKTVGMGPAAGSRMTFIGGGALVNALEQIKQAMEEAGTKTYEGLRAAGKPTRYEGLRIAPSEGETNRETMQGPSFVSDVQNIQMAEVEVNTETGDVRVIRMTTAVDSGPIINPQAFTGQLEGGMDQGVGYALREEYDGGYTKDWLTFKFPTINDTFELDIMTEETLRDPGTLGATGIGEMTMVSTAPAVTNAIYNACGGRVHNLPATPERVKAAIAAAK